MFNETNNFIIKDNCYLCNLKFIKNNNPFKPNFYCTNCNLKIFIHHNYFMISLKSVILNIDFIYDKMNVQINDFYSENRFGSYYYDEWIDKFKVFNPDILIKYVNRIYENYMFM